MKHWVFDLDGTLVDSFSHYFRSLETIFTSRGKTFSGEHFYGALTHPLEEFFAEQLGAEAVSSALDELKAQSVADAEIITPYNGIPETLERLANQNARIAIWTNRDLDSAERILKQTGLAQYAELCVSGTCVTRKPSPAGLERILERFGCKAGEVTVVGDHEHDVTTPKSLGARAVRASWHSYWKIDACTYADAQFFSVSDFKNWVFK